MHMFHLVFQVVPIGFKQEQRSVVMMGIEDLSSAFVIVGTVFQGRSWHFIPRSTHVDGNTFLATTFAIASDVLHFDHVVCVRACRGVTSMFFLKQFASSDVLSLLRGDHTDDVAFYTPEAGDWANHSRPKR